MSSTTDKIKISILGSCIGRDMFEIPFSHTGDNGEYVIERFTQSISPLSAVSAKVDDETANMLHGHLDESPSSAFYKRCLSQDLAKTPFEYLAEVKSDFLIIDITTVRSLLLKVKDTYVSWALMNEVFSKVNVDEVKNILAGERVDALDIPQAEFDLLFKNYAQQLLAQYDESKIIVLDLSHVRVFADSAGVLTCLRGDTDANNKLEMKRIDRAFACLKSLLPNAHYIDRLPFAMGNTNHKWGKHGLHYMDEVYRYLFESVDFITHNPCSKADEELALLNIKDKYVAQIMQKEIDTVTDNINSAHNILPYSIGMQPGEWQQNGLTLKINPNYSFELKGKATEPTVFYLFSRHKNPVGNWSSVDSYLLGGGRNTL